MTRLILAFLLLVVVGTARANIPDPDLSSCSYSEFIPDVASPDTIWIDVEGVLAPVAGAFVEVRIILETGWLGSGQATGSWSTSNSGGEATVIFGDGVNGVGTFHFQVLADNVPICTSQTYAVDTGAPPPPPPPEPVQAAVMLHVKPVAQGGGCAGGPAAPEDILTTGQVGEGYYVYLLASPPSTGGLAGLQFGIAYEGGAYTGTGLGLFSWTQCSSLDFPGTGWPASGSGNTITWDPVNACQTDPIAVAGLFYAYAYAPATLSIVPWPNSGLVKVADCDGAELVLDQELSEQQVGWVSMGGAGKAGDDDGCNPALEPCGETPISVEPVTWGAIKARGGRR